MKTAEGRIIRKMILPEVFRRRFFEKLTCELTKFVCEKSQNISAKHPKLHLSKNSQKPQNWDAKKRQKFLDFLTWELPFKLFTPERFLEPSWVGCTAGLFWGSKKAGVSSSSPVGICRFADPREKTLRVPLTHKVSRNCSGVSKSKGSSHVKKSKKFCLFLAVPILGVFGKIAALICECPGQGSIVDTPEM